MAPQRRETDLQVGDRVLCRHTGETGTVVKITWYDPVAWDVIFEVDGSDTRLRYFETAFERRRILLGGKT